LFFLFSSPNPAYIRPGRSFFFSQSGVNPGRDRQSPNRRIRTHQTKNTKTQNGKKFNTPKQQEVTENKTRKNKIKKINSPAIKPGRPLNHSPEIIKPKQENRSIWIWISTSPAVILLTPAPSSTTDLSPIGLPLPSPSV
jgi:hypothetical protein